MSVPEYKLEDLIKNAIGDKPVMVQKAFDNVVVQRAADIIAGKREEIAAQYSAAQENEAPVENEQEEDEDLDLNLDDISDEELDDFLDTLDDSEDDLLSDEDLEDLDDNEDDEVDDLEEK